ncbi:MAG TPA: ATP-binding protein [Nocardioidaceae bacterium]|nr:ATP-binding protein [Nocardioidaceae bacterium]
METRSVRNGHAPVTVRVPFAASSVAVARRQFKSWMSEMGLPREVIEDGRVIISELVGNSIRHAQPLSDGTILISWGLDNKGIRLSVSDGGSSSRPRALHAPASALSGRGMAIVETLALDWWSEHSRSRSTIHALLPAE